MHLCRLTILTLILCSPGMLSSCGPGRTEKLAEVDQALAQNRAQWEERNSFGSSVLRFAENFAHGYQGNYLAVGANVASDIAAADSFARTEQNLLAHRAAIEREGWLGRLALKIIVVGVLLRAVMKRFPEFRKRFRNRVYETKEG